jgi:hypothetical protein
LGKVLEPGTVTAELPLDLPDCFKNANPYTDCRFRFGRITGKQLTAAQTDAYKRLGAAIDKAISVKIREIAATEGSSGPDEYEQLIKELKLKAPKGLSLTSEIGDEIPKELLRYSSATIWDRSTKLAGGYGYALDADGAVGPGGSPAALKAATQRLSKPQIDPQHLRQLLNSTRQ